MRSGRRLGRRWDTSNGWLAWRPRCFRKSRQLIQQQLIKPRRLLSEIHNDHHREVATYERVASLLPEQAFAAGRDFERETRKVRHARREFAEAWAKTKKKLGA